MSAVANRLEKQLAIVSANCLQALNQNLSLYVSGGLFSLIILFVGKAIDENCF